MNGRWGQVVEETTCCHLATDMTWKVTLDKLALWRSAVHNLRMSAVKDVLPLSSCSNLCQPIIHSPHHLLETFRPFLLKATGAAQSDFGLVQLQVDRKLLLNWICLGVQRNRLCHTAGPVQLMQPNFPCGQLSRHVRWRYKYQVGNMGCGHWECLPGYSCAVVRPDTRLAKFNRVIHNEGTRRESQGQPKAVFEWKNLIEQLYDRRAETHERFYSIEVHRHRFARHARKVPFEKCEHWRKVCGRSAKDQIASTL